MIIVLERSADTWTPHAIVRFNVSDALIVRIVDYTHFPWVLSAASLVRLGTPARIIGTPGAVLPGELGGAH